MELYDEFLGIQSFLSREVKRLDPRLLLDVNPGGIEEKTHRQKWTFEHMVEEAEAPEH